MHCEYKTIFVVRFQLSNFSFKYLDLYAYIFFCPCSLLYLIRHFFFIYASKVCYLVNYAMLKFQKRRYINCRSVVQHNIYSSRKHKRNCVKTEKPYIRE